MSHSITIRMGAANWDALVLTASGPIRFDFRRMTVAERKQWYGAFMDGVRKVYGRKQRQPKRHSPRKPNKQHRRRRRDDGWKRTRELSS